MNTMLKRVLVATAVLLLPLEVQGQNLVPNGGFESGMAGWEGVGVTDAAEFHSGLASLKVVDDSATACEAAQSAEPIPVTRGQSYRFELWARGAAEGQETLVAVDQYDASGNWISGSNIDFALTPGSPGAASPPRSAPWARAPQASGSRSTPSGGPTAATGPERPGSTM